MNRPTLKSIAAAALLAGLVACVEKEPPVNTQPDGDGVRVPITLYCAPLDTETGDADPGTRTTHPSSALTRVSNVNYYLFRDGALVGQEYFPDAGSFAVTLPSATQKYTLLLLANVGKVEVPSGTRLSEMGTAVHVDYGSRSNYFSTIQSNGFPMANTMANFSASSGSTFYLDRLVHTLYVKMNTEELQYTKMTFTGVQVKQAPRDIHPFSPGSKATVVMDGDAANLSSDDIALLNAGETVPLYLLENMRGDLIPGNASWKNKIPSRISSTSERSLASYIEMTAKVQTPTATYENNIYRAYLGKDASNFDVERATYFVLNNNFTNDMVRDEDWRVDPDDPAVTGGLTFVYPEAGTNTISSMTPSGNVAKSFHLMYGFKQSLFIRQSSPGIQYTVTASASPSVRPHLSWSTTRMNDTYTRIDFWVNRKVKASDYDDTFDGYSYTIEDTYFNDPVTITVQSTDGLVSASVDCRVLYQRFQVMFKYYGYKYYDDLGGAPYAGQQYLRMMMWNPLKLKFNVTVSGKVTSYIEWLNSWMGSWKNETLDQSFSYSTTVVPDTDLQGGAKIDRVASYAPYTSIEDACLGANIYLTKNHNVKLGTTYERLAIPKRIQVNIAYKMDTFASDQPGLSYNGTFTPTTIYGYLTPFNRCDYLRGADMNIKYQYRGNENDNQSYKMVFYGDHNYDWKVWSWDRNTNLVDLTLNGSSTWTVGNPDL